MTLSALAESRVFRSLSYCVAFATAYIPSAVGVNALANTVRVAIEQLARLPHGNYTVAPGSPFLGKHPGRDLTYQNITVHQAEVAAGLVPEASLGPLRQC